MKYTVIQAPICHYVIPETVTVFFTVFFFFLATTAASFFYCKLNSIFFAMYTSIATVHGLDWIDET